MLLLYILKFSFLEHLQCVDVEEIIAPNICPENEWERYVIPFCNFCWILKGKTVETSTIFITRQILTLISHCT